MKVKLSQSEKFENRHHGYFAQDFQEMLQKVGVSSLDELISQTVPENIRLKEPLKVTKAQNEHEFLNNFKKIAQKNKVYKSFIGMGYYDTHTPNVILRNILENPAWYTAYTPYQAEIAQGRLEALINYQTMVIDLTGMEIANASLLDEATAAAEAMAMLHSLRKPSKKEAHTIFVDENVFPQTLDLIYTRALPLGIKVEVANFQHLDITRPDLYAVVVQYPNKIGETFDYTDFIASAKEQDVFVAVGADLLALTLLKSPGEMGADVVFGSSQRFGVQMGYGGPHAAFFATKEDYKRQIPGRIIGVSIDAKGNKAYRMALQTREQHIRREKATSNICTAQVLLSVMASMYAVYHGAEGLSQIAQKIYGLASFLKKGLQHLGYTISNETHFDTICVEIENKEQLQHIAESREVNFNYFHKGNKVSIALDETTQLSDISLILDIFALHSNQSNTYSLDETIEIELPTSLARKSTFLTHPVFNSHHTEHDMLRYMKYLENKDLSLVHSMISLGSCTMKLNATAEMIPVTWAEMAKIHPFAPKNQTEGYQQIIATLSTWLAEITGFDAVSMQPNSGAQGEYAGLMVIRAYHESRGEGYRNIALIPASAHGTNPASAVMAGMEVIVTKTDEKGNIDVADLQAKAEQYKDRLSCLMVTYPSTHGVFEESIQEICRIIHENGGQVYMDGANMNAQVGLTSPATIGADVCHLNLHKTFSIPHGGGGPGMGPICMKAHLAPFMAGHFTLSEEEKTYYGAISAAPFGSASILAISYAYIAMMGGDGLMRATQMAILNANYIKERLAGHYEVLYTGTKGRAAHEMILDCRPFKTAGIEAEDIAKRLMDYGFHAPTLSFPVAGTLMVEPTESESKAALDLFCDAMIEIRNEIREIKEAKFDAKNNVLKNAPHTAQVALAEDWTLPYTREKAVFPLPYLKKAKFWPTVSRIDSAYGDRNLVCSCIPIEEYANS
ncbi:MAG: aminomethyl-transferring glycine dehydrogenase [Thermonemataceae bacterium]|nr:aminomethyl-transferring glycine dehydrogenase [Thermonemataceae bacterium]